MLSYGFYNSKGGDRKYDAEQFGAMFNGLITDGVFAHYKDALKVTAGSGNRELVIKPGRAWFNGTWTEVDDNGHSIHLMGSVVETTYFVYLAVNKSDRKNTIAWYSSIANNDPEKGRYFYLLAQVTIPGGVTKISESMITDTRGSDLCPYVTGIMETVSFEELVKRVCGDSWQDWLGVYEAGITAGVQNAVAVSKRALDEVESVKAYAVESEATSYIWAKFEAVPTGGGGFEWATDSVHTELSDPPMPVCLFRDLSYADLGPGFRPNVALNLPYVAEGETAVKAIPAVTQSKVWREYPYFWEGGAAYGTDVLRYDDLQRVIVNVGGTASEKYRYRVSRLMHIPVTYEPGAYIGTVTADNATAYPRDGYKDGCYYMRFSATAEDVSFNCPDLSAKNVRDAIVEIARMGGEGSGTAMSVIEVEELPSTGVKGVFYIVKKPGDSDASEYLWLDRWEKVGGTDPGQNVNPVAKTEGMTQPVGVDEDGRLWTAPTAGGGSVEEVEDILLGTLPMTISESNCYMLSETNATISTGEGAAQLVDFDVQEPYIGDATYNGGAFEKLGKNTIKVGFANVAKNATVYFGAALEVGKTYTIAARIREKTADIAAEASSLPLVRVSAGSDTYAQAAPPASGDYAFKSFDMREGAKFFIVLPRKDGYVAGETHATVEVLIYEGTHTEIPTGTTFDILAGEKYPTDGYMGATLSAVSGGPVKVYKANTADSESETDNGGVIFFGDSILHYSDVVSRYATKTGKPVLNCAVGGTRMSASRDIDNPYYPLDMANIADAIASGDFSAQLNSGFNKAGFTGLSTSNIGNYKAMIVEFGTNDFTAKVPFDGEDATSIKGAIKHILRTILTRYPNMRIVVLSTLQYVTLGVGTESGVPTHDDGTVWHMNEVIRDVCQSGEFCIPWVDMYHAFGQNPLTRGTVTGDGVHLSAPNGAKRYADILVGKLNALGI